MRVFNYPQKNKQQILALGPESNGNFSVFSYNKIYFSEDFGDLLKDTNFNEYQHELNKFLRKNKIKPDIILTDLHPLYKTTILGKDLAKKYKAKHIQIQHHIAHIFSAVGEKALQTTNYKLPPKFCGIALDGTGYGTDGKIWGGECFAISNLQFPISNDKISKQKIKIERIGSLENQVMIGGELAIQEPARMLISILDKITRYKIQDTRKSQISNLKSQKDFIYSFVKKYYSVQEFEVLYNQLQQNFNCIETSSCGRVLDAVSILLGFCKNERKHKHEPILKLEANSTKPYLDIKPKIEMPERVISHRSSVILNTTCLFEYLIKNLHKDKKRLAATAQLYIAEGLAVGVKPLQLPIFLAGGIANNKIISEYLISKGAYVNKKIPRGDAGLSFGQIIFYLANPRN
ncbi:MAG: hypothetical protein Q7T51_02710 [Candidatus Moranbacteria bacterium]|nr:hypothetical protein [Candidatus Moranbacteria bacterium]